MINACMKMFIQSKSAASDKVTSFFIGFLLVVCSISYFRLPSTSGLPLPTTFDEAVIINKGTQLKKYKEEEKGVEIAV